MDDDNEGGFGEDRSGSGSSLTRMLSFKARNGEDVNQSMENIDPFLHDQLRVLDRTSPSTSSMEGLTEAGYRSVLNNSSHNRKIPKTPSRILDAPELVDDYYLNLVSWGSNNVLAVALGQCVYLWEADTGDIKHLLTLEGEGVEEDYVTSVCWANQSSSPCSTGASTEANKYIAVGTNKNEVQLWDTKALKKVRTLKGHSARVGSLSWNNSHSSSSSWLSSG
eukprot:11597928-Ditylum_brightwellii.AAC.1